MTDRARMLKTLTLSATAGLVALVAGVAPATAREIQVGSRGPGPDQFDSINVQQFGPKKPDSVLVLMPGTAGGAGDFTANAKELTAKVDGLAVWALDRRSQVLEDTGTFTKALDDEISPDDAFDYYLGWLTNGGTPAGHYNFLDTSTVPFAKRWGMKVALKDARQVVKQARDTVGGKGEVFLGGHSLGASLSAAYAAWDFDGKPGYKDLDGIVMIDGGLLGSFDAYDKQQAEEQVATLDDQPFLDLLGIGVPEAAGLFAEAGAIFALKDPDGSATTLQNFPLLPADFKPPVPATNEAAFGYAFDRDTSPPALGLLHVNAGTLAASGNPRPWVDGGVTTAANLAAGFGQEPANGVEWFFPRRLTIDTNGANQMKQNDVAKYLGLRLTHTDQIDIPIYAFQSDLTDGAVLKGAERLVKRAKTTKKQSMLVDGDPAYSHLDPLLATPGKNKFTRTVAKFLKEN
jgi:pimeloyl-ACP methyl ester carboxylesterase